MFGFVALYFVDFVFNQGCLFFDFTNILLVLGQLIRQTKISFEHCLDILKKLIVAVEAIFAFVDDAEKLVRDALFVLVHNGIKAALMTSH